MIKLPAEISFSFFLNSDNRQILMVTCLQILDLDFYKKFFTELSKLRKVQTWTQKEFEQKRIVWRKEEARQMKEAKWMKEAWQI